MHAPALSPEARTRALAALSRGDQFDVIVIGGGVVGAGCALDAVTRGLTTALLEADDWAAGTSSRSSKLIHGGLRYLEMLDFALVREALRERGLIVQRLAPHLATPVSFLYPLRHRAWERCYAGAGVLLYDTLGLATGHSRGLPHHRHLSRRAALRACPALRPDALVGAVQYYDAQLDDARNTLFLARTAAAYGAQVATRTKVVGLLRAGPRLVGVRVCDQETGEEFAVAARQVINATGVWTDDTQRLAGADPTVRVRASKGIHLVVPRDRIEAGPGLILRTATSVLFVIPWGEHWLIGTTDTPWHHAPDHPTATSGDIDYLLTEVNKVLVTPLHRGDVQSVYAGLRPLLTGEADATAKLSREHTVSNARPGLVTVAGGKYTTYRIMARDAVDMAVRGLDDTVGRRSGNGVAASCTERIPLLGAEGFVALWNQRGAIAATAGLPVPRVERLLRRYGSLVRELLDLVATSPDLAEPLAGAEGYLAAEIAYAAAYEGANHLTDVLTRRTRIAMECPDRGIAAARPAAEIMGRLLDWSDLDVDREVAGYQREIDAALLAEQQPDDDPAGTARLRASNLLLMLTG